MKELVGRLKEAHAGEFVIFDLPPMLSADDLLAFLPQVDCTLLVAAVGQSSVSDVRDCEQLLSGANLLGVVLNKTRGTAAYYYNAGARAADRQA
jgi:Mrp family chromosome partitioning ATPase